MRKTEVQRGEVTCLKVTELSAGAEICTQAVRFQSLYLSITLNNHNANNSALYHGILHQNIWLRQLVTPNIHFPPFPSETRTSEYQLGAWVWRIKIIFPSLLYSKVRPCDYILTNEIWYVQLQGALIVYEQVPTISLWGPIALLSSTFLLCEHGKIA